MRLFFSKHELKLRRKRTIAAIICAVVVLGVYWILTRPQKAAPEMPTVIVEPVVKDDVEIYGEYVGRIRAQQFVEVRARVEGYLENMLLPRGHMSIRIRFCLSLIRTSIVPKLIRPGRS